LIGGAVASAALFAAMFLAFDGPDEPTASVQEPAAPVIARPEPPQVAQVAPPPPPEVAPPQVAPSEPAEPSEAAVEPEEERPRRRRRLRASRARPGTVNVVTPGGWAEIFVRGRRVGRSPGRIELPSGPQTITIRPFGTQPPRTVRVDVPSGGTARVSLPVRP
jgi:serine/threonine-protein kinase